MSRTKSVSIWFIAVLIALAVGVKCAEATVYYLAPDGNDTTGDGTSGTPYRTLGYIAWNKTTVGVGDTIYFKEGTYPSEELWIGTNGFRGAADNYMLIAADPEASTRPLIDGNDYEWPFQTWNNWKMLNVWNGTTEAQTLAYVKIEGIEFTDSRMHNLSITDASRPFPVHHIIIEDCKFSFPGWTYDNSGEIYQPLKMEGVDTFLIKDCIFENSRGPHIDLVGCHYGTIINCSFVNSADSVLMWGQGVGVTAKGGASHITIANCYFENMGFTGVNIGQATDNAYFRPTHGSNDGDGELMNYEAKDVKVYGSVFVDIAQPIAFNNSQGGGVYNCTMYSPVLRYADELSTDGREGLVFTHRWEYGDSAWQFLTVNHSATITVNLYDDDTLVKSYAAGYGVRREAVSSPSWYEGVRANSATMILPQSQRVEYQTNGKPSGSYGGIKLDDFEAADLYSENGEVVNNLFVFYSTYGEQAGVNSDGTWINSNVYVQLSGGGGYVVQTDLPSFKISHNLWHNMYNPGTSAPDWDFFSAPANGDHKFYGGEPGYGGASGYHDNDVTGSPLWSFDIGPTHTLPEDPQLFQLIDANSPAIAAGSTYVNTVYDWFNGEYIDDTDYNGRPWADSRAVGAFEYITDSPDQYYVSPTGHNDSLGTSVGTALATFAKASSWLSAGDTLSIVGGTYTGVDSFKLTRSGTATKRILIRNYDGTDANINCTNPGRAVFIFDGADYFDFDGGTLDVVIGDGAESGIYVGGTAANRAEYFTVDNVKITGAAGTVMDTGIDLDYARAGTIISTSIAGTEVTGIDLTNTNYVTVSTNNIEQDDDGGGIFLGTGAAYNLIDNNYIHDTGDDAIKLAASSNSVRRNRIYKSAGAGVRLEADGVSVISNIVYNNTIFGCTGTGVELYTNGAGTLSGNRISNNIVLKSTGNEGAECSGTLVPEMIIYTADATAPLDSTSWGANHFNNNNFRHVSGGATYDSMMVYVSPTTCTTYSIAELLAASGNGSWTGCIGTDPALVDEDPDNYAGEGNWYDIPTDSPCADAGMNIIDWIGLYVYRKAFNYGWDGLTHYGASIDIGAAEATDVTPPAPVPVDLRPPSKLRPVQD